MSKLIEQNQSKKSRFLKYSLLASISVGAVMTMPFEGMATGSLTDLGLDVHIKALQDDDFIKMQRKRSESFNAGGGKKKRPPIRSKNTPEPIEQTPQKSEIIITEASPASLDSDSFVTAPNTPPNTNSKAARRLSFSREPQQIEQANTAIKPKNPPKPSGLNKLASTKPQKKAQVTKIPAASSFLNQQKQLDVFTQQEKVKAARQAVVNKNRSGANEVKRDNAKNKKFIDQRDQDQLKQNQQYITTERTKKQQQAEDKKRKEENYQKAKDIADIKSDISTKMRQISNINTTPNKSRELASKVEAIKNKEQQKTAQKQLSEIQKQEKTKKTVVAKAQKISEKAKKETSRIKLKKLQEQMDKYVATITNDKVEEIIKKPEGTPTSTKQSSKTVPTTSLTPERILGEQPDEYGGYLVPKQGQQQDYITVLPDQDHKSMDSGFRSKTSDTGFSSNQNSNREYQKEPSLNVDNKLIEKAAQLISDLEQKRKEIQETTINKALKKINNDQQAVIKITQELQKLLIHKPKNVEKYSTKIEKKSSDIERKKEEVLKEIGADIQVHREVLLDFNILKFLGYQNNLTQTLDKVARENSIKRPILFQNLLKDLEKRKQEAKAVLEQARVHKINNSDDNEAKEPIALVNKLLEKYDTDIELVRKALEDNKENSRKNNNVRKLSSPGLGYLGLEEKFAPLRKYDVLDESFQKMTASKKDVEAEYHALRNQKREQNPDVNLNNDPELTELAKEYIDLEKKQSQLQQEVQPNIEGHTAYSFPNKPVFSRLSSVSSLNSWDDVGDIVEDHRYEAEDSCPTPDHLGSTRVNISDENSSETKLALLRTLQMAVTVKRQELEQLPSTSSGVDQIAQQINKLKGEEEDIRNVLSGAKTDPSKFDQTFSMEKIEAKLKQYNADFPNASKLASVGSISDLVGSKENLDEEFDKLAESEGLNDESASDISDTEEAEDILAQSLSQEMLVSDGKSESTLPAGDEEQEDTEVTDVSRELSLLPASSNEYELALSDGSEKECLALSDGSEDEESYDSGFKEEEETMDQLSDSSEDNLKTTEIDTAIPLKQEAMEEVKKNIETTAPTLNQGHKIIKNISNIISTRLDPAEVMATAIAAGDEEETRIKRGLWVCSMYGINNHGRVEDINGYRGTNKGATIGFDVEIDNNIVGIAYSNVHSVFKFKNSKNNDKELINSHVVSIYGQKELPRNFALQALVSASKNFIKDKTTYSYGDTKIRSNVKHRNHSYNAEALLNYSYLLQNKLVITPNIGLRYGKSRDGVYNETGINVQEIALTMKENNILSGIVGTKVKVPLKDALKFNNLGLTFQGAVEHNFKEKTQRINRVVKIFDNTFKQDYLIPKQPKTSYNLGTGIIGSIKNITISLDYNYYLNKHYRSHQGSVKLKVNL